MTIIAAYQDSDSAHMACDTAMASGSAIDHIPTKIYLAGGWLLGISGDPGPMGTFLRHSIKEGTHSADGMAAAWRIFAKAEGLAVKVEQGPVDYDVRLLLARPGELWVLESHGYAVQIAGNTAVLGCGAPEARGALYATYVKRRDLIDMTPADRIRLAVGAACAHDAHCGGRIIVETILKEETNG